MQLNPTNKYTLSKIDPTHSQVKNISMK